MEFSHPACLFQPAWLFKRLKYAYTIYIFENWRVARNPWKRCYVISQNRYLSTWFCCVLLFHILPSEILIPNLPNRWRQNMNSVSTDHYQHPLLTVCLYPRGAEGWEKLQQCPLITNLPLCVKFGTKLIGIRMKRSSNIIWHY